MKRPGALITTHNTITHFDEPLKKKIVMTNKLAKKFNHFFPYFFLSKIVHQIWSVSFALNSVDQYTSNRPLTILWGILVGKVICHFPPVKCENPGYTIIA